VKGACAEGQFTCANGKCISYDLVCDKQDHCGDESDEPFHCGQNECARVEDNGCGHICVDTKDSFHCKCNPGYRQEFSRKRITKMPKYYLQYIQLVVPVFSQWNIFRNTLNLKLTWVRADP
jgi:hypothetical protein